MQKHTEIQTTPSHRYKDTNTQKHTETHTHRPTHRHIHGAKTDDRTSRPGLSYFLTLISDIERLLLIGVHLILSKMWLK